jgi:hypothetical protein
MKGCHYWLTSSARYPLGNRGSDIHPRLLLWIHIHLCRDRHAILRAGSSGNASKPKERRLRKRPKEREALFDESTLFLPTLRGQSWTPVQPRAIMVFTQSFLPGNILPKITRIASGRCSRQNPPAYRTKISPLPPGTANQCHRARILPQSHPSRRII